MTDTLALSIPEQRAAVVNEAMSWLGTPYHHHARVKGVGVDCAQILIAVYSSLGLAPGIDPGHYAHDWHLHQREEVYIDWVQQAGGHEVDVPDIGDIGLFQFGRTHSHSAIWIGGGRMVHALLGAGVILSDQFEVPLTGRPVRWFSLFKGQ